METVDAPRIEEAPGREEKRDRKKPRKLRCLLQFYCLLISLLVLCEPFDIFRCFANLEGLPGVPDPKPLRNCTKLPEDRENPIVRAMKEKKVASGKLGKKDAERIASRKRQLEEKEAGKPMGQLGGGLTRPAHIYRDRERERKMRMYTCT